MKKIKIIFLSCCIASMSTGYTQEPFVTTWEIATGNLSITIPTMGNLTYNYTVDWGDGVSDTATYTGDATHTYQAAGTYTVAISGDFPAIHFSDFDPQAGDNSLKIKTIKSWGTQRWLTLHSAFEGCESLTTIEDGAGVPDLTMVTDMENTFRYAPNFNSDLSSWDVSNVTSMSRAFSSANSFNSDLSSWNVSNVTSMWSTFFEATSFNGDLSSWNVSKVTNMNRTFFGANNFNGDLSSWNVSNANNMNAMFANATSFNRDLSTWDVSNVTDMEFTFYEATSFSSENYDALLTGWASLPSLQNNVIFGAPPTTYCNGRAGRDKLTSVPHNWDISGDLGEDCSGVSVDDEFLSNTKIYPNPSNDKISIESSFEIDKLELYNVLGAKIFSISKTNVLDLGNLRQGIYILKVFSADRVLAKKVIKD